MAQINVPRHDKCVSGVVPESGLRRCVTWRFDLKAHDIALGLAELDADQVNGLVAAAVFVGVAPFA